MPHQMPAGKQECVLQSLGSHRWAPASCHCHQLFMWVHFES